MNFSFIQKILGKENTDIYKKMMKETHYDDEEKRRSYLQLFYMCEHEPKYTRTKMTKKPKTTRFFSFMKRSAKFSQILEIIKRTLVLECMFLEYQKIILDELSKISNRSKTRYSSRVEVLLSKGGNRDKDISSILRVGLMLFFLKMATACSSVAIQKSDMKINFESKQLDFAEYNNHLTVTTIGIEDTLQTLGSLLQTIGLLENKEMKDLVTDFNKEYKKQYIKIQKECNSIFNTAEKASLFENPDIILQKMDHSNTSSQMQMVTDVKSKTQLSMQRISSRRIKEQYINGICKMGSPNVLLTYEREKLGIVSPLFFMEGVTQLLMTIRDVNIPLLRQQDDDNEMEITTSLEEELTHKIDQFIGIVDTVNRLQYIGNPLTQTNDIDSTKTILKDFQKDISTLVTYLSSNVKEFNALKTKEAYEYAATVELMDDLDSVQFKSKMEPTKQQIHDIQNQLDENDLSRVEEENIILKKQFKVAQDRQDIWYDSLSKRILSIPKKMIWDMGLTVLFGISMWILILAMFFSIGSLSFFVVPRLIRRCLGINEKKPKTMIQDMKKIESSKLPETNRQIVAKQIEKEEKKIASIVSHNIGSTVSPNSKTRKSMSIQTSPGTRKQKPYDRYTTGHIENPFEGVNTIQKENPFQT